MMKLLPKIDYRALVASVQGVEESLKGEAECEPPVSLPELPEELSVREKDELVLRNLHKVLLDIHVMEGDLICPDTGRKFPVKDGIPNMILHEDEI